MIYIYIKFVFSEKLKGFTSGLKFNEFFLNLMMGDGPNLFLVLASLPLDIVDISKLILHYCPTENNVSKVLTEVGS